MKRRYHEDSVVKKENNTEGTTGRERDQPKLEIPFSPEKRSRSDILLNTNRSPVPNQTVVPYPYVRETDPAIIQRRIKQIEYGKNTPEYVAYSKAIPKDLREPHHPKTPNVNRKYSRRAWDGLIKHWRVDLHLWNKSEQEISLEHIRRRREKHDDAFSTSSTSTSTNSKVSDNESGTELERTVIKKEEKSWFEDCEDWEQDQEQVGDYLDLHAESDEDDGINVTIKTEPKK